MLPATAPPELACSGSPEDVFAIMRELMFAVTDDQIELCSHDECARGQQAQSFPVRCPSDVSAARAGAYSFALAEGLCPDDADHWRSAVAEACNNVVIHGGGDGWLHLEYTAEALIARVRDTGQGIPILSIPRAVLQKGWSSIGTLGMGFYLMRENVHRLQVATSCCGTTVTLLWKKQQDADDLLERYLSRFEVPS